MKSALSKPWLVLPGFVSVRVQAPYHSVCVLLVNAYEMTEGHWAPKEVWSNHLIFNNYLAQDPVLNIEPFYNQPTHGMGWVSPLSLQGSDTIESRTDLFKVLQVKTP